MHAYPVKPRVIVARADHDKHPLEHPPHLSPKHAATVHPRVAGSPPNSPGANLEAHRVEAQEDDENLASHPLPRGELPRIHSLQQHPIAAYTLTADD